MALRNIRRDALKAYEKLEKVCFIFTFFFTLLVLLFIFSVTTPLPFSPSSLGFSGFLSCVIDHLLQEKKLSEDNVKDLSSDLQVYNQVDAFL